MSKNWFPKTQNIYEILLKKISSLFNKVNDLEVTVSSNALPDQSGNDDTFLFTDGTSVSWQPLVIPENVITLTLTQFQALVNNAFLQPGKVYKITGVHKNKPGFYIEKLYDDGNDLGITIYLTALTSSTFTNSGYGEFYNPKYQPVSNYNNTDKTGLWGIYDQSVTYEDDDRTIWGGYMWEYHGIGEGSGSLNDFELEANWVKLPYSDTSAYKKVIDYIEYDYDNDFITRRRDEIANIDVDYKLRGNNNANWSEGNIHPIAAMQYGNYVAVPLGESNLGSSNNTVVYSYFNCVNFKTVENSGNYLYNNSVIKNNITSFNSFFINNKLFDYSIIGGNILSENSQLCNNFLRQSNIIFSTISGQISFNDLEISSIQNFTGSNSTITNNNLKQSVLELATSGTLSNKNIRKNSIINCQVSSNISAAIIIFGDYQKNNIQKSRWYNKT